MHYRAAIRQLAHQHMEAGPQQGFSAHCAGGGWPASSAVYMIIMGKQP